MTNAQKDLLAVGEVFSRAAPHYDLMNNVMSGGLHHLWKAQLVAEIPLRARKLIDVATGSGDIALLALQRNQNLTAFCCDPSAEMLAEAKKNFNARSQDAQKHLNLVQLSGENLPFAANCFDVYSISFGIRNIKDRQAALCEAHRVLKAGGLFLCLEFSSQVAPPLAPLYNFYSDKILPRLAKKITGDEAPYRYLVETIKTFPPTSAFNSMVADAGFSKIQTQKMSGGVVALTKARKV